MEITDHTTKLESASEFSGGFSFDLFHRNENLIKQLGSENVGHIPKAFKTGTTIVGIIYKDGIVLGADTRATGDSNVMDKNCAKIHYLAPNIFCCGAGTAADTEKVTELIASNLELLRLSTGTQSRVVTALTLLKRMLHRYQGHIGAALIVGGCDVTGPCLYSIQPHGSSQMLPYHTMGSGSLAAMAVFETRYTEDIEENAAIELVKDSVRAGIFNDLGSGSNIDVTVIRRSGEVSRLRNIENAAGSSVDYKSKFPRPNKLNIPIGATYVISETFKPHKKVETAAVATAMEVV